MFSCCDCRSSVIINDSSTDAFSFSLKNNSLAPFSAVFKMFSLFDNSHGNDKEWRIKSSLPTRPSPLLYSLDFEETIFLLVMFSDIDTYSGALCKSVIELSGLSELEQSVSLHSCSFSSCTNWYSCTGTVSTEPPGPQIIFSPPSHIIYSISSTFKALALSLSISLPTSSVDMGCTSSAAERS